MESLDIGALIVTLVCDHMKRTFVSAVQTLQGRRDVMNSSIEKQCKLIINHAFAKKEDIAVLFLQETI